MKRKRYYLFGELPCLAYERNDSDALINALETGGGSVYMWDGNDPNALLDAFDGWNAWVEISKVLYDALTD